MATQYGNRIRVAVTNTGTGSAQLGSALTGFKDFSTLTSGSTVGYAIDDGANWEVGTGTYTSGSPSTVTRTNIEASTNAGSAINLSGSAVMMLTLTAAQFTSPSVTAIGVNNATPMAGGLSLGSVVAASQTDLTHHISLWGGNAYGFSITSGTLNVVSNSAVAGTFTSTGLNATPIGASTISTGAFTTLSASSTVTVPGSISSSSGGFNLVAASGVTALSVADPGAGKPGLQFTYTSGSNTWTLAGTAATNLTVSLAGGTLQCSSVGFTGGSIDGTTIGSTTPAAGTFDGTLQVGTNTRNTPQLIVNGVSGSERQIHLRTAGSDRWQLKANSTTESGSNAGSDFSLDAYNDAGSYLLTAFNAIRSSGYVNFFHGLAVSGGSTTIDQATIGGTTPGAGTFTALNASSGNVLTNIGRNLFHNPMFNVAQRGAGAFTATGYTLDRWRIENNTDTMSFSQVSLADADRTAIGDEAALSALQNVFTGNSATSAFNVVYQRIETPRRLSGKTVTVSFWAKAASGTPKLGISIDQWWNGTISTNSGSAVTLSTTWTRYNVSIAIPSGSGKTQISTDSTQVNFWFSSGATQNTRAGSIGVQSGTISLWGMQLEISSTMTQFEKIDPADDLARCQRFYVAETRTRQYAFNSWAAGGWLSVDLQFPTIMRATPTINWLTTGTPTNYSSASAIDVGAGGWIFQALSTAAGACSFSIGSWNASADL